MGVQGRKKPDEKIDFMKNIKTYFRVAGVYRWLFVFIIIFTTLREGLSVVDKFLFKIVIDNGTEYVAGELARNFFVQALIGVGIAFILVIISKFVISIVQISLLNRVESQMMFDIKTKFFNHIVNLHHGFHVTHKTGSLIARMNRGGRAVEGLTDFFIFNFAPLILQILIVGGSIYYFDKISALVLLLTSVTFLAFGIYISKKQQKAQYEANAAEDIEKANIADTFTNIDSVKYFGKENWIKRKFGKLAEETKIKLVKFWNYGMWFGAGESLILGIGTFFLIYFPLIKLLNGEITIGTLTFIYTVYLNLVNPLFGFVHGIRRFYTSLGDVDDLFKYAEVNNEIEDKPNAPKLNIKRGEIKFDNVEFTYDGKKNRALHGITLDVNSGEKIALVGHSGCGKTTLVKLLYRLYDVKRGSIKIDGVDIRNVKQESLRGELSIVPQEAILFDDSIFNNIKFSNPSASKEEVFKAIKFAQLDRLIKDLPQKENTIVGERGVKLSGGERQRVSIARAILANKKILVLDEATSALDSETEYEIQKDLEKLMQGRTSIIIAHRLSTIMKADKIVVLEKGKIVQIGKHNDLINQQGQYRKLWNLQKGGYLKE